MRNSVLNRIIAAISAIFMPIINIMTAAGITKGFLALFVSLGWIAQDSGTYLICNAIADAFFYFCLFLLPLRQQSSSNAINLQRWLLQGFFCIRN